MKKRLFAAIVVMACLVVSCQKNEEELPTFEARTESGTAKTELVGSIIQWVSGDQVKVFGDFGYAIYNATPRSGEPTWATLTPSENHGLTGLLPYRFVYPASMASGGASNNNTLYVDYPQQRSFSDEPMKYFAMYGQSSDYDVAFMNLGGMLKIHMQQENTNIREVIVKANENFAGRYSINQNNVSNPLSGGTSNEVKYEDYMTIVDISEGIDLYVSMPAGSYSGMTISIIDSVFDTCIVAAEEGTSVVIERSKMATINISNMNFNHICTKAWYYWGEGYPGILTSCDLVDLGLPSGTLWGNTGNYTYGASIYFIEGSGINLPTMDQINELSNYCTKTVSVENGVKYLVFRSNTNNNEIRIRATVNSDFWYLSGLPNNWNGVGGTAFCMNGECVGNWKSWIEATSYEPMEIDIIQNLDESIIIGPLGINSYYGNKPCYYYIVKNVQNSK